MAILPVETELLHAKGQQDGEPERHDVANSRFPKYCERH